MAVYARPTWTTCSALDLKKLSSRGEESQEVVNAGKTPTLCALRTSMLLCQHMTLVVIEEVTIVATHSKTRRAVQRLRRLARRLRAATLKKTRPSGTVNPS